MEDLVNSAFLGIGWAGIVMLINFCMWEGNILAWYYDWLDKQPYEITNVFGLCKICFCFWFGIIFFYFNSHGYSYAVFLGFSEMIIIFYHLFLINRK